MTEPTTDSNSYGWKNIGDKNPIQISGAIVAVVNVPVIAGWITLTVPTVGALETALVAVLGLFISSKTANKAVLNELSPPEDS